MTDPGANHPQPAPPQKKGLTERWKAFFHREESEAVIEEANVQVFASVGWIDRRQLWVFEMVSSLAVILLAFGLVTSQTNVQTHGAILSNNPWMQDVWAWTQNIAIDMSLLGAIIRCAVYGLEKERGKALLYGLLALLLLFTAFIVSDVEAIYQSLHGLTLDTAWSHLPLVNVELLTSIRSFAIVLLLVAHAVQYINWYRAKYRAKKQVSLTATSAPATPAQPIAATATPAPQQQTSPSDVEKLLLTMQQMNQQNLQAMQAMMQQGLQVTVEQFTRVTVEAVRETVAALPVYTPPAQLEAPKDAEPLLQSIEAEQSKRNAGDEVEASIPFTHEASSVREPEKNAFTEDASEAIPPEASTLREQEQAQRHVSENVHAADAIHTVPNTPEPVGSEDASDLTEVVKRYPKVAEAWLAKGIKSVSIEEVIEVTGHSRQRVVYHARNTFARTPKNPEKYTVASVLKWLHTVPAPKSGKQET